MQDDTNPSPQQATVLVVDDISANQKLLRETLEPEGYEVLLASEGATALAVAQAAHPDVILLDIQMPGLNGFETCRRLKQDDATRDIPVIFITANEDTASLTEAFRVGAVDFVAKPFRREEVLARVATHLKINRLARSLAEKNQQLQLSLSQTEQAKQRSDQLLHVILPHDVAGELKATSEVRPRRIEAVAVLFSDIVGFTAYCHDRSAGEVHEHLQRLVSAFEEVAGKHSLEKIKTIGDSFMAMAPLPSSNGDPALAAVLCGLEMIETARHQPPHWSVRVGVHLGPVTAGILGTRKFQYDIWGDTVNVAKRLQEAADPGTVCVTTAIWPRLAGHCSGSSRGRMALKGKGQIELFCVEATHPSAGDAARNRVVHSKFPVAP
jgi:CheY-like chemotaxis protein